MDSAINLRSLAWGESNNSFILDIWYSEDAL